MRGVLTLAGEGTRMLPWTRGLRKEFLPLYDRSNGGPPSLKPVAHLALETLADAGASDVTLVVAPRDRSFVENYFTVDPSFLRRHAGHEDRLEETRRFYGTLGRLRLHFVVQPTVLGFGDAVLRSAAVIDRSPFVLHAADGALLERRRGELPRRMAELQEKEDLAAVLLVRRVEDARRYGVVEGKPHGRTDGILRLDVRQMQEKPARPRSHWAATAVYAFSSRLFPALRAVARERRGPELELTDAIARLVDEGDRVAALVLTPRHGEWRSVGSPEGYLRALNRSRRLALQRSA
jgi:UTP--glucose-1-phosphate uridylyltransferase